MDTYFSITNQPSLSQLGSEHRPSFDSLTSLLTDVHFGRHKIKGISKIKPNCDHFKAFIQVRHKINDFKGGAPVYKSLQQVKREELINLCIEYMFKSVQKRQFGNDPRVQLKDPPPSATNNTTPNTIAIDI